LPVADDDGFDAAVGGNDAQLGVEQVAF